MIPDIIKETCRRLRSNSTKAEIILWGLLKQRGICYKFMRQYPLYVFTENSGLDRYIIPDFYCKEKGLIIEIDGNVHDRKDVYELDKEKDFLMNQRGLKVLRFTNDEVLHNTIETLNIIKLTTDSSSLSSKRSPEERRDELFNSGLILGNEGKREET